MSHPKAIDHLRVKHAVHAVSKIRDLKKYRSIVLSAGTAVRQIGLPQYTAFCLSKGGEHLLVSQHLYEWLKRSDATRDIMHDLDSSQLVDASAAFMTKLLQRNSMQMALLEAEAQAVLVWMKRMTVGLEKEKKRNNRQ
jgi:CRISPR type III-B/RAMP module-associated protein Cmr5